MNIKLVTFVVGIVLLSVSPLLAICGLIARLNAEKWSDPKVLAFVIPFVSMFAIGGFLSVLFRRCRESHLLRRDGLGVVTFSWVSVCFFGAMPFYFTGLTPAQAFFESVSGFTTTGSSVYGNIESLPSSILVWRSLTQWVGGLGILVFLVALLMKLGVQGRALIGGESSVNIKTSSTSRIGDLAFQLFRVYLALTFLCFFSLLFAGGFTSSELTLQEAFHYTLTTISTGGFSPHNNSVAHFDSALIETTLIVFMFVSSISFVLLYQIFFKRDFRRKAGFEEAVAFLVAILLMIGVVTTDLMFQQNQSFVESIREAAFPVVSMASSTGFGTADYDNWPLISKVSLCFVMIIGGCGGSTAGGLKVIRFVLLLRILKMEVQKTFRPSVVVSIRTDGRKIDQSNQYRLLVYIVTVGLILILSSGLVSIMEPRVSDFESAFGAVLATFFNMGPGFSVFGPTDNFGGCHSYTLLFLGWLMILGRLEIFVVLALFSRAFWKR